MGVQADMNIIRIRGLQRSGTNILERMCNDYFENTIVTPYKKHNISRNPDFDDWTFIQFKENGEYHKAKNVCIMKDPFAHKPSLDKHYDGWDMDTFIDYWEAHNRFYYQFHQAFPEHVEFVKYIDFLENTELVLKDINYGLNICSLADGPYEFPGVRMTSHNNPEGASFDPTYYTEEKFMKKWSNDEIREFQEKIDYNLIDKLGYK